MGFKNDHNYVSKQERFDNFWLSSVLIVLNRYRQRKRAELDTLEEQLHGLEGRNRELRDKAESVEREIQYVKDLLIEVYKARSQRLKQETSAWPKARPPDDGPASRIVSSLIGNGDLSWNVFWLNVFRMWWRLYYCTLLNHFIFVTNWQSPSTAAAQTSTFSEITPNQLICTVIMSLTVTTAVFSFLLLFSRVARRLVLSVSWMSFNNRAFTIDRNKHRIRQDRLERIFIYL